MRAEATWELNWELNSEQPMAPSIHVNPAQQAVIDLKLWTDVDADSSVIREAVEEFLEI